MAFQVKMLFAALAFTIAGTALFSEGVQASKTFASQAKVKPRLTYVTGPYIYRPF